MNNHNFKVEVSDLPYTLLEWMLFVDVLRDMLPCEPKDIYLNFEDDEGNRYGSADEPPFLVEWAMAIPEAQELRDAESALFHLEHTLREKGNRIRKLQSVQFNLKDEPIALEGTQALLDVLEAEILPGWEAQKVLKTRVDGLYQDLDRIQGDIWGKCMAEWKRREEKAKR